MGFSGWGAAVVAAAAIVEAERQKAPEPAPMPTVYAGKEYSEGGQARNVFTLGPSRPIWTFGEQSVQMAGDLPCGWDERDAKV